MSGLMDYPNREALGLDPPWVGVEAGEQAAPQARAGTGPDLDAMNKQELLDFAKQLGVSPANNNMEKSELRAGVDAKLAGEEQAVGTFSDLVANSWLDAVCRATAYSEAAVYVKLHLGDPGSTGASNPAVEATRQAATFGAAATGRAISNTVAIEWVAVSTTETYTWISLWDASTSGNFLGRDDLSSSAAVTAGDTFRIPIGDLDLTVT